MALTIAAADTELDISLGQDASRHLPTPPESLTHYFRRTQPFWLEKAKESTPMFFEADTDDEEDESDASSESDLSDSELLECTSKPQLHFKLKRELKRSSKSLQRHAFVLATQRLQELQPFCDDILAAMETIRLAEKRDNKRKKALLKAKKKKAKEEKNSNKKKE